MDVTVGYRKRLMREKKVLCGIAALLMRSVESGVVVLGSSAEARVWHDRQPENVICSTTATLPPVFVRRNAANFVLASQLVWLAETDPKGKTATS